MKKFVICAVLYLGVVAGVSSVNAATFRFDPTSFSGAAGDTFDVDILVDPGTDQISAVEGYINFDSDIVSATNVQTTDLFDNINQSIDTNQVYLNGLFTDGTKYIDEEGILATVTFQLNSAEAGTLQIYCDKTQTTTSKIVKNDVNATNVIECSQLNLFSINGGTNAPSTTNPTPTILPATGQGQQQQQQQQQGQSVVYATGTLPQSGIFDNVIKFSVPGVIMLAIGVALKFLI